ncbi:MAG: hypothetical protein QOD61_2451 [Solirubrobacteraceae bacterium]|nr:hypothetical protein [Solirubrobacteraceae bacterium]
MPPPPGHLAGHPLPPGIAGALGLGGYQLIAEIAGVGVGRLGEQVFLLAAGDPDPQVADPGTQIALHHPRLRAEAELPAWTQLAAQLGYLRLSGYRLALERDGLRSGLRLVDPASGRVAARIPSRHPGRLARGSAASAPRLLATLRGLPPAGPPPDAQDPELLRQVILALALGDDSIGAAEAVELADRAVLLASATPELDPPAALAAARQESG